MGEHVIISSVRRDLTMEERWVIVDRSRGLSAFFSTFRDGWLVGRRDLTRCGRCATPNPSVATEKSVNPTPMIHRGRCGRYGCATWGNTEGGDMTGKKAGCLVVEELRPPKELFPGTC